MVTNGSFHHNLNYVSDQKTIHTVNIYNVCHVKYKFCNSCNIAPLWKAMDPFEFFWAFFLTFLVLMLQKGYLDQIGVEFHQKWIGAIVNWPTPNWWTIRGFMGLFVKLQPKPKAKRLGVDFVFPPSQQ